MKRLFLIFTLLIFISGCTPKAQREAVAACQSVCQQAVTNNRSDMYAGPCLSEAITPDWVCDVAHNPRQPIDDDPRNQCASYRAGTAHHFVEVDGTCGVINVN